MARPLRLEYADALHHVISRGGNRRKIVWDDADRRKRLEWLQRTVEQQGWKLHAFCLMTNHEHLFVQTPLANLGPGMKLLNAAYTQYINKRHRRSGHLFQGRYKAHLVQQDGYFASVSRYIHLNPVRAKMVEDPAGYAWSSFPGYARGSKSLDWVTYRRVLSGYAPGPVAVRRRRYAAFVRAGVATPPDSPWAKLLRSGIIGGEDFVAEVRQRLNLAEARPGVPDTQGMINRPPLAEVVRLAVAELDADTSGWKPGRRGSNADRTLTAALCRQGFGYGAVEVARELGFSSASSVTNSVKRVEETASLRRAYGRLLKAVRGAASRGG